MDNNKDEALSVAEQLKEHANYFAELGIELIAPGATAKGLPSPSAPVVASLPTENTVTSAVPRNTPPPKEQTLTTGSGLFQDLVTEPVMLTKTAETFEAIHEEIGNCVRCPLHAGRTHVVHTEGNREARLMFVGEAPGADEDAQARPFVGRAGQLLTKIIEAIGFKREEVLIGNVNRCRPPGNRPPTAEEAMMCKPFLLREIASVQPEVIVVLGNTATRNLLETKEGITKLRGRFQDYKGVPVMPTFHPAYLLRDPSKKRETWDDLKKVRDFLDNKKPRK